MKHIILLLCIPFSIWATTPPEKETKSTITKATVYLSGAQVERTANCTVPAGETVYKFSNLSPFIDENSIQISGLEQASITSLNYTTTYIFAQADSDKIKELENLITKKERAIALLENAIKGLNEEETLITTNRKLISEENASLDKLKQFASYYRERISKIATEKYDFQTTRDSLQLLLTNYRSELNITKSKNKEQKGVLTVVINSNKATQLHLNIKYNVTTAGWFPVYDVKTASTESNLDIYFKAHVYQDTGEDWDNVNITLSTADPTAKSEKPEMVPHYLNFVSNYNTTAATATTSSYKYNPFIKQVSGVVLDNNGQPLPGANIVAKGTNISTVTDFDGKYTLNVEGTESLQFSYIGFQTQEKPIYSSLINITLAEDTNKLEEVVVTGYGTDKKKSTASVQTLQGQMPGLQISTGRSRPGSSSSVKIRGIGSINSKAQPLYVIDGVPQDSNYFNKINPNSIATINVLNDASATAIYGSRGRNGIIVITTKDEDTVYEEQNITSVEYKITQPQNIPSVMDVTVIDIHKKSVTAKYEYIAAPVLNENVFLTATLTDFKDLKLLPGETNVYFSGVYVGKTYINPYQTKKDMVISLGIAPTLTIKRTLDNNFKTKPFIGSTRIVQRAYTIELQNNGNKAVTVKLLDRIPISQNKEIKVDEITNDADTYNEEKGLLEWSIPLDGGARAEKHLSYEVKFPKGTHVNLE